jgi:hypothetical protein
MSTGPTEATNNLIKRIKRVGFGFGKFASYRIPTWGASAGNCTYSSIMSWSTELYARGSPQRAGCCAAYIERSSSCSSSVRPIPSRMATAGQRGRLFDQQPPAVKRQTSITMRHEDLRTL